MTITPDQARELLDVATPGPWHEDESNIMDNNGNPLLSDGSLGDPKWYNGHDITLMAAAPDLAQTIAGMTEQWRAEYREIWGAWLAVSDWTTEDKARLALAPDQFKDATTRLVRRLVGPVEVTE